MSSQILIGDICAPAASVNGVGHRRAAAGKIRLIRTEVLRLGGWNSTGLPSRRKRFRAHRARDGEFPNRATAPQVFSFLRPSTESLLKARGTGRPLACVTPTFFRALRRSLLSPRWSRPKRSRNLSGARKAVPLRDAIPPPEIHPGPKARCPYVKLWLSGNRFAGGPGCRFGAEFRGKPHRIGSSSHRSGGRFGAGPPRAPVVSGAQLAGAPGIIESRTEV